MVFGAPANPVLRLTTSRTELYAILLVARLAAGLVLLVSPDTLVVITVAWVIVAATTLVAGRWRAFGGEDGSDQMLAIISVACAISLLLRFGDGVPEAGLYFIGSQACLAYSAAGIAKLTSPYWRSGLAIQGVLQTRTHGTRRLTVVQRSASLARVLCWVTISFETAFVVAPILPPLPLLALLTAAALFHVGTALVMGLNGFVWSFVATYPAIVFLNQAVRGFL